MEETDCSETKKNEDKTTALQILESESWQEQKHHILAWETL